MAVTITEFTTPVTVTVDEDTQDVTITVSDGVPGPAGPAGPAGAAGPNSVTSATSSDGTANLSVADLQTTTATVTGTLTASHIHGNLAGSLYAHVRAGENLAKGDPVYISGSHGSGSTLIAIVSKARADNAAKMPAVGIMDAAVSANANGHMVIAGTITELNTNSYAVNGLLYVGETGGLSATGYASNLQPVARVERVNANNGAILVEINPRVADIGAATAAQGALADTAVQPSALDSYVPYTGATGNMDLGANTLDAYIVNTADGYTTQGVAALVPEGIRSDSSATETTFPLSGGEALTTNNLPTPGDIGAADAIHTHVSADITDATEDGIAFPEKLLKTGPTGAVAVSDISAFVGRFDDIYDSTGVTTPNFPQGARAATSDVASTFPAAGGEIVTFNNLPIPFDIGALASNNDLSDLGNTSAALTNLGAGTTGHDLFTASDIAAARLALGTVRKITTSDVSRSSTTTFADDATLASFAVSANTWYLVEFALLFTCTINGGIKTQFSHPALATQNAFSGRLFTPSTPSDVVANSSTVTTLHSVTAARTVAPITGYCRIRIGANSGNLSLQWAQNISSVDNTTLLAGSLMTVTQL